ncbi:glycosyltransferase family 1 protein [Melanomma pulvis-pyrius CBS 109.77]|uniref:Glycosyltransferase family 1 protein n=1 Tax=Melanomma pulvis-pyrius CBS 109.77 TaxID=1314802 RepID=A0A6A6X4I5_9PLEO|nr:glycosyltransferase family 1 protein [Melanomma pulvis-pyrius CBS 109.77]
MGFFQRLLSLGFVPILALLALQLFAPEKWHSLQDALEPYIAGTALSHLFPHPLPLRSATPILIASTTHWSHVEKVAVIATELAALGYPITFMTGRVFEKEVSSLHRNIKFEPYLGNDDKMSDEDISTFMALPSGPEKELFIMKKVLVDGMPSQHESIQLQLQKFRKKYNSTKPLIVLFDQTVTGEYPILFGSPGIQADANIGISLAPLSVESNYTFPFRSGKVPHTGPDAKAVHAKAYKEYYSEHYVKQLNEAWWAKLREMGAVQSRYPGLMEAFNMAPDYLLTLGIPEFEFPRSDLRSNVRWFGAFKNAGAKDDDKTKSELPSWWDDIAEAKREGKKIVAVSQGTVEADLEDVLLPTIEALKERDDVLVIATTVLVEPGDVKNLIVPGNTRVAKFVPYGLLLPLIDVLVSNGGYGAVQHCVRLGLPMVVSGVGQDKATTNAIVQWSGVGINLAVQQPGAEKIRDAVKKVLEDDSYKKKAVELSKHYDSYNVGKVVDGVVRDVVRDWVRKNTAVVGKDEL